MEDFCNGSNNMDIGTFYQRDTISDMLINDGVKKNDATSIINAFKRFCGLPFGTALNWGAVYENGRQIDSLYRNKCTITDNRVILYSLLLFTENCKDKITNADDTQAFQWFIEKTGPDDDHPLLTVDMLWDFFYVKGRDNLTADIRMILDTFPQQQNLREDEKRVLKTILIMQAMIGNYISGKSQPTYIVKMTPEEMAFYEVTEKAWGLESDSCAHISQAQVGVKNKMQSLRLPVWSLKEVDNTGVYLDDISVEECAQLKVPQLINVFRKSKTESNVIVKGLADEFRKNQTKTKMFSLWREKTGSKTPREWSAIHRTPILCLIPKNLYDDAKKAFEVLNRTTATEKEIESALAFLEGADFYADLTEPEKVDQAFAKMLGRYKTILTDIEKVRKKVDGKKEISFH